MLEKNAPKPFQQQTEPVLDDYDDEDDPNIDEETRNAYQQHPGLLGRNEAHPGIKRD